MSEPRPSNEGLFVDQLGAGKEVVFLHGLGGSTHYWPDDVRNLATSMSLNLVDLGGFGRSMRAPGPSGITGQVAQLRRLTDARSRSEAHRRALVRRAGRRSLALDLATEAQLVLFNVPAYPARDVAMSCLRNAGLMERWLADEAPIPELMCAAMCRFRRSFRFAAPLISPKAPILDELLRPPRA